MLGPIAQWFRESFHSPWWLLLLPLAPVIWYRWVSPRGRTAVGYSSFDLLADQPRTWAVRGRFILPTLRTLAVVLLIVSIARPRKGNELTRISTEGIAIQLVADRSGSMRAADFQVDGQPVNRVTAVQKVVREFVKGGGSLAGRPDDMIGLIVFARYPDSQCPLTLDHDYLLEVIKKMKPATDRSEDGTAIGDAVALGVEQLRALEQSRRLANAPRIKSRVTILLTDGGDNASEIPPAKAAEMAAAYGIRLYAIGTGTRGQAPIMDDNGQIMRDPFGNPVLTNVDIDEETLTKMAESTGGKYFRATDTDSLTEIYGQIDKMEKTRTEERRFMQYKELATEWTRVGGLRIPPLLLVVLALLGLEILLASTRFRRLP